MTTRHLAGLLVLVLLSGMLPTTPATAADDVRTRSFGDAAFFELASEAVQAASGRGAGSTWKDLDGATQAIIEVKIEYLKFLRRDLVRQMRRDLRKYSGQDHACERAEITRVKREKDAALERHLKELRHVRGDHRKAFTKLDRFIRKNVIKPLGEVAKKALRMSLDELVMMYLSGGALNRAAIRTVVKRSAVRVARKEGRTLIRRTAERTLLGRRALPTKDELAKVCDEQAKTGAGALGAMAGTTRALRAAPADDACDSALQPIPPFAAPAIVIYFDWDGAEKYQFSYGATSSTDPVNDPSAGADAEWAGGCTPEAELCTRPDPIVLAEAPIGAVARSDGSVVKTYNWSNSPGNYTLIAESAGICSFLIRSESGPSYLDVERLDADIASAPAAVELTATIEYYAKDGAKPHRVETRTVSVPFHPYEHLGAAGRRVFGDPVELPASGQSPSGRDEPAPWDVEAIALDTEAVGAEETER